MVFLIFVNRVTSYHIFIDCNLVSRDDLHCIQEVLFFHSVGIELSNFFKALGLMLE